jgi:pSer/pThr/pTyr-binding forkhead associated (FHA) protein
MLKVQLVVTAAGPNKGRAIPLPAAKFMIGRDPDCQLRPASQAVSKKHCAIEVRDDKVYVQDIGSTNGTVVRGEIIQGEVEVQSGDALKIGPLEFRVEFTQVPVKKASDQTPTPEALKDMTSDSKSKMKAVIAPKIDGSGSSATQPIPKPGSSSANKPVPAPAAADTEGDAMAAMLLALDGDDEAAADGAPVVPEGSTIMEMPAVNPDGSKKKDKKATISGAEMSSAANDILRRYIRRTGGGAPGT